MENTVETVSNTNNGDESSRWQNQLLTTNKRARNSLPFAPISSDSLVAGNRRDTEHPSNALSLPESPSVSEERLYEFQQRCIAEIYEHIRNHVQCILLIAACATGKTRMAAWIIRDTTQKAQLPLRCVFLVSLNCLLEQTAEALSQLGVTCSILQGNRKFDASSEVIVASIQTIRSRLKQQNITEILGKVGLVFVDEAHSTSFDKVFKVIHDRYLKTGTVFIGLTATPYRAKKDEYLGQWFDQAVIAPQPPELVRLGKLVPCRKYGFGDTFDLSKLDIGYDGDYQVGQIESQGTTKAALDSVVREWQRLAENRITVAFCATVKHAQVLCDSFCDSGISSEYITGETSFTDRKAMFERLTKLFSI